MVDGASESAPSVGSRRGSPGSFAEATDAADSDAGLATTTTPPLSAAPIANTAAPSFTVQPLGKLQRVDVRKIWGRGEEYAFTPWLSEPGNLALLGETLGMDLEFVDREVRVGRFEADIVAKDLDTTVVIENQLERTDHDHLGKLLVYASGLEAKVTIWIAREVTDEYRNALDWLNENTREGVNFFGVEIEMWRIGESAPAPKFNLVCQPNEWKKTLAGGSSVAAAAPTETKQIQLEFWTQFAQSLADHNSFLTRRKPHGQHWYDFAIGRGGFNLTLTIVTPRSQLGCELYINHPRSKLAFQLLRAQKREIEAELGELDWRELPSKHACRILQYKDGNLEPRSGWPALHALLKERAESFHKVFAPRVQALDLDQPEEDDEGRDSVA
jgi:hypothetical protein